MKESTIVQALKKERLCFDKVQAKFWFSYHEKERENLNDKTIAGRGETFCRFDLIYLLCSVPSCRDRALFHDKKEMSIDWSQIPCTDL